MLAWIVSIILVLITSHGGKDHTENVTYIPPKPTYFPLFMPSCADNCTCDECCYLEALYDYEDSFTELFNSYEITWSKNGRLMIRQGNSGPYKFVKRSDARSALSA